MAQHRISFDRNIQSFDSGMVYRSTSPRIQKWATVAPILRMPGPINNPRRRIAQLFFHWLSIFLLLLVLRDVYEEFRAIRKRQRVLKRLQNPDTYEPAGWDNVHALATLMAPFSWSGYDVGICVYGLICENIYWRARASPHRSANPLHAPAHLGPVTTAHSLWKTRSQRRVRLRRYAVVDIPPIDHVAPLDVADVMKLTMYANACVLWVSASGVFMGCLFVRLLKPMSTFRRFHVYLRVVELAFDQFKDFAILFLAFLVAGSLGYSFVCQARSSE